MARRKHKPIVLSYTHEGNDCFVVKFDPKMVEVVQRTNETRFIAKNNSARFEII